MNTSIIGRRNSDKRFFNAVAANPKKKGAMQNGVSAPTVSDYCFPVWTALDELLEWGTVPSAITAKKLAISMSRDVNGTIVTYLQWRKFHNGTI